MIKFEGFLCVGMNLHGAFNVRQPLYLNTVAGRGKDEYRVAVLHRANIRVTLERIFYHLIEVLAVFRCTDNRPRLLEAI